MKESKFEIIKGFREIKKEKDIVQGCTFYQENPCEEVVEKCESLEKALEGLKNYKTSICWECYHKFFAVTEYMVRETVYEDGEFVEENGWKTTEIPVEDEEDEE